MDNLSDLILDSKLDTRFDSKYTIHVHRDVASGSERRGNLREEYWCYQSAIGAGAFGRVWLEKCVQGHQGIDVRAVKRISTKSGGQGKQIDFNRELEAIAKFSHRKYEHCFIKSFGWYLQEDGLCITMEYLQHGDLGHYMSRSPPLSEEASGEVTYQILEGLSYMHDNHFAHRDLKPQNILIKSCPPQQWWVKIGDFGISKRLENETNRSTLLKGTMGFIAPELHGYTTPGTPFAADMWSVAEISFQLMIKKPAFETPAIFAKYALEITREFPSTHDFLTHNVSSLGQDFILSLMMPTPGERRTVHQALKHQWMEPYQPATMPLASVPENIPNPISSKPNSINEELASWNTIATAHSLSNSTLSDSGTTIRPNLIQDPGPTKGRASVHPTVTISLTQTPYERGENLRLWSDVVPEEVLGQVSDRERKRQETISEIIYTERNFVRDLEHIRDIWISPLRSGTSGVKSPIQEEKRDKFVNLVFGNVLEVLDISSRFARELSKRQQEQHIVYNIGDIFLKFLPQFEPFVKYGANQMYAKYEVEMEKKRNPAFSRFIDEKERIMGLGTLESFLNRPTTRLARYPLLLDAAFGQTENDNPDRKDIAKAIKLIMNFLVLINTEGFKAENHFNILHLTQHLTWNEGKHPDLDLTKDGRVILKNSSFMKSPTSKAEVQVYLFDHVVLMCVKTSNKGDELAIYKKPIPLEWLKVAEMNPVNQQQGVAKRTWSSLITAKSDSSVTGQNAIYPIMFRHFGKDSYEVQLYAKTKKQCTDFIDTVAKQQGKRRDQPRVP